MECFIVFGSLSYLQTRPEASQTGVYILSGLAPNSPTYREIVHIGQSVNVLARLKGHLKNENKLAFWEKTAIIISKDINLTRTHILYLESRLIELAFKTGRAVVNNDSQPVLPDLPEGERADMDFFLDEVLRLLPVVGFHFAQPLPIPTVQIEPSIPVQLPKSSPVVLTPKPPVFTFAGEGIIAQAVEKDGSFVVLKGSHARSEVGELGKRNAKLRDQLRTDGTLVDHKTGGNWLFSKDVPFSTTSAAASVVAGNNVHGEISWKVKTTGQSYKDWKNSPALM